MKCRVFGPLRSSIENEINTFSYISTVHGIVVARIFANVISTCQSRSTGRSARRRRRLTISKPNKKENKSGRIEKFIMLKHKTCVV